MTKLILVILLIAPITEAGIVRHTPKAVYEGVESSAAATGKSVVFAGKVVRAISKGFWKVLY